MFDYMRDPLGIEEQSFAIIKSQRTQKEDSILRTQIIERVIHTTADFEFESILGFRQNIEERLLQGFQKGCRIITDTEMIRAGINKRAAARLGIEIHCFVGTEEAYALAGEKGITRSMAAVDLAARLPGEKVFVIGNAPTALYRILELQQEGKLNPQGIIGVPVGFVGAAESKEALWEMDIPAVITRGPKGGSTIAVAIVNAVLREAVKVLG